MNVANRAPLTAEHLSQAFKACGDPLRLTLLRLLSEDAFSASELAELLQQRQNALSHHLKLLTTAGLLDSQREGNSIFFRRPLLNERLPVSTRSVVFHEIDQISLPEEVRAGLARIRSQRQQQSLEFFRRHSDRFQDQQERIAPLHLYAPTLEAIIDQYPRPDNAGAIEIGPGCGHFLPALLQRFQSVRAIDNSAEMLEAARRWLAAEVHEQRLTTADLQRLDLIEADAAHGHPQQAAAELVVMNMVLHHVAAPAEFLQACSRLLAPGGLLLICDLAKHDQSWTREACGDVWLGFDSRQIQTWGGACGLEAGEPVFLGARNGFQVNIHPFSAQRTGSQ